LQGAPLTPIININKEADIVEKQNFLGGFFGKPRPLMAEEIDYLFFGIQNNDLGVALTAGFQQVARSEQVRAYMARGAEKAEGLANFGLQFSTWGYPRLDVTTGGLTRVWRWVVNCISF
jgi:hypothetical protein